MRNTYLLLIGIMLLESTIARGGDGLKLHARETKTPKLGLNANGEVIRGEGNEFFVVTDKEKSVLLAVIVKDTKRYLSYSGAKNETPKLILVEKPDENSHWVKEETIPRDRLQKESPLWGSTQFRAAAGPFANRLLAWSDDNNLVVLMPDEMNSKFRHLTREILWDNLNEGK
jgi:hypothetical protein